MNSVYKKITSEEKEVVKVVHEFIEAVSSFEKLSPNQKKLFSQNVALQMNLADVLNDDNFYMPRIFLRSDKWEYLK